MRDLGREQLLTELRAMQPTFRRDGVLHMALFGSRARNENRADSDVDLLIEVDRTRKFSLLDAIGVGHVIEDQFGLEASVLVRDDTSRRFLDKIMADVVTVF